MADPGHRHCGRASYQDTAAPRRSSAGARDEARHFAFYSAAVSEMVRTAPARSLVHMRDVVAGFRMPLSDTLRGYWRWSLEVADTASYDHTEAYDALTRIVRGFAFVRGTPEAADLLALVDKHSAGRMSHAIGAATDLHRPAREARP